MANTLVFFCDEKSLYNLSRYNILPKFLHSDYHILATNEIANKFPNIKNFITYDSTWTKNEISTFTDYLYIKNCLDKKNKALNMILRTRIFGSYKVRNLKTTILYLKNMISNLRKIDWKIVFKSKKITAEELLNELRNTNLILANDLEILDYIIDKLDIKSAISFTTLSDPKLFDFVEICDRKDITTHVFPDSWDNFSSAPYFPANIKSLQVWSEQHVNEIYSLHPYYVGKIEVIGSYRITKSLDYFVNSSKKENLKKNSILRIVYLEGFMFEDFMSNFKKIIKSVAIYCTLRGSISEVELIFRRYPLPKQTEKKVESAVEKSLVENNILFLLKNSNSPFVIDDLRDIDFVISDCTTAALEAIFAGLEVIFIGSRNSPRYIDTMKIYNFSFSKDLYSFFPVINLSSFFSTKKLKNKANEILRRNDLIQKNPAMRLHPLDSYSYFALPLNTEIFNNF